MYNTHMHCDTLTHRRYSQLQLQLLYPPLRDTRGAAASFSGTAQASVHNQRRTWVGDRASRHGAIVPLARLVSCAF
jgi:hypothetical protein